MAIGVKWFVDVPRKVANTGPSRDEADVLNWAWDWAAARIRQSGHPYYSALTADVRAMVRSYGKEVSP